MSYRNITDRIWGVLLAALLLAPPLWAAEATPATAPAPTTTTPSPPLPPPEEVMTLPQFKRYYQQITELEQRLQSRKKRVNIDEVWQESNQLRRLAKECIAAKVPQSEQLANDLTLLGETTKEEDGLLRRARNDLIREQKEVEQLLTSCRLLLVKSETIQSEMEQLRNQAQTAELVAQEASLFELLQLSEISAVRDYLLATPLQLQDLELWLPDPTQQWLLWGMSLMGLVAMIPLRRLAQRLAAESFPPSATILLGALQALLYSLNRYGPLLLLSLIWLLFWGVLAWLERRWLPLTGLSLVLLSYLLLLLLNRTILRPIPPAHYYLPFPEPATRTLSGAVNLVGAIVALWAALLFLPYQQPVPPLLVAAVRLAMVTTLVTGLIWLVWVFFSLRGRGLLALWRLGVLGGLVVTVILELLGYRNLSSYLLVGMSGTLALLAAGWLIAYLSSDLIDSIEAGRYQWQQRLQQQLGLGVDQYTPSLFWLRLIWVVCIWLGVAFLLLQVWAISPVQQSELFSYFSEGFQIGTLTIVPSRILFAVALLAVMLSAVGWFKKQLEEDWLQRSRMDVGARTSIVSISGYLAGMLAIMIALSLAGVDLSNLAMIAGALSVGIGFGLQNIVNNFVSGLILLFERPIRRGDWVVVNGTEGTVQNINIRSTIIRTFDRADVIVPNSELISGQVTNWMLKDLRGRAKVPIGVAYGSDIDLVKRLLLEIAESRPEVITDGTVAPPMVIFIGFGDSALNLELRFFVQNVDERGCVISEVNYAIYHAFRHHHIEIPFPQRDLHLRSLPPETTIAPRRLINPRRDRSQRRNPLDSPF